MSVVSSMTAQNDAATPAVRNSEQTFWEARAETRWGRYITAIVRQAILAAHAKFSRPGKCLDVGCEGGRWCKLLDDIGWQVTGIDVNPVALGLCQERHRSVRCILVDKADRQFPVETASIDLLLCLEAPVADCPWFPGEAARVLRPDGQLVGTCLNLTSWRAFPRNLKSAVTRSRRFYVKSYLSLTKSLRSCGLHIDSARGCCWAPFGRESNSRWIPAATKVERWLRLDKLTAISPWVIYNATRLPPANERNRHVESKPPK